MQSFLLRAILVIAVLAPSLLFMTQNAQAGDALIASSEQFGGFERHWYVHLPLGPRSHLPLVIALHGGFGFGQELARSSGLIEQANQMGFAVVFPDGWHRHWNDGRNGPIAPNDPDDVAFLSHLAEVLPFTYPIDPARIYLIGISNGGVMTLRVACDPRSARHFAGFLAIAASVPASMAPLCRPLGHLNVVLSQGTADPLMPFNGGLGSRQWIAPRGPVIGQSNTANLFISGKTCQSSPWVPFASSDRAFVTIAACRDGTRISRVEAIGEGHCWPEGAPKGPFITRISGACHYSYSSADLLRLLWSQAAIRD